MKEQLVNGDSGTYAIGKSGDAIYATYEESERFNSVNGTPTITRMTSHADESRVPSISWAVITMTGIRTASASPEGYSPSPTSGPHNGNAGYHF